MCAVQWACRLFPFHHVSARWVCVLAAGDTKHEVREQAAAGLRPPARGAAGGGNANGGGGGCTTGHVPRLYDVLLYARSKLPRWVRNAARRP